MLSIILGPPRAGKTYKAVCLIKQEYELQLKSSSKYRFIYTNINGLKFDEFNGFVKQYNKIDFINATQQENSLNIQHENGFLQNIDNYDDYALKNGIYANYHHCLLILDEAYNTFTKNFNENLGRFLSYHGHFGLDVIFLLQSKRQTNREYLVHTELMYIAQPSGKRLFSKLFRYKVYSTSSEKSDNLIRTENLKFDPNISNLYSSGSNQIYQSFATKKIIFLILFAIFSYLIYKFLQPNSHQPEPTKQERFSDLNTSIPTNIPKENNTIFDKNKFLIKITCFPNGCKFRGYDLDLSMKSFLEILSISNCKIFLIDKKSINFIDYYAFCPAEFENSLKKLNQGVCNDKKDSSKFIISK